MATIRRHPVPPEFYEPDRPLNDLRRDQLEHFKHIAERLPAHLQVGLSVPWPEQGIAATQFIAAVTERLMSTRKPLLTLVRKRRSKAASAGLDIAAEGETRPAKRAKAGKSKPVNPRSASKRGA